MTLESGLDELEPLEWMLGGLRLKVNEGGDQGLDDVAEIEGDDEDAAGDGSIAGDHRLASREVSLEVTPYIPNEGVSLATQHTNFEAALDEIKKVMSPLPDRTQTRVLRWRRQAGPAKRLWVRPALGRPLVVPGDRARINFADTSVSLRLEAPDPVIYSDHFHEATFTAGQTRTITNAGSFTAVLPSAWWLSSEVPVILENLDHGEYVRFPSGPVTVSQRREIITTGGTWGLCFAPNGGLFPRWPLLRPGDNTIRASAACTLYWRDTW